MWLRLQYKPASVNAGGTVDPLPQTNYQTFAKADWWREDFGKL
jgi:hypothetical protein